MKLDTPDTLELHGVKFTTHHSSIYKSEQLGDELYLDTEVKNLPTGDRVKLKIIVSHLVSMESKWCKTYKESLEFLEAKTKPLLKLGVSKEVGQL